MKTKMIVVALAVATGLLVTDGMAQHNEHHPDQAALTGKAATGTMGGMMAHENMMSQMMTEQNETGKLVDRLMTSLTVIEQEKNSTARKQKLAEHGALLKELQGKVQAQTKMMDMMQHMMGTGVMNGKMMDDKKTMGDDHK